MNFLIKNKNRVLLSTITLLGIGGGYLYYYFIGCPNGSCAIQSNPFAMSAYGGLLGYTLSGFIIKEQKNKQS